MAKRRGKGDGSIYYSKANGRWVGQMKVSPDGARRRRKTVYGKTKAEVRRKLAEVDAQLKAGNETTASMTFAAWLDYWLEHVVEVRPNTKKSYERTARLYLKPALGSVRLDKMNLDHPTRLKESMTTASSTKQQAHRVAGNALQAAMERGLTVRNPFRVVRAPRAVKKRRRALSVGEFNILLTAIAGRPDEARWLAAIKLGARQGECLGLTWDRVDMNEMVLDFEWQAQRIGYAHGCGDTPCKYKAARACPQRYIDADETFDYEVIESNICWVKPKTDASRRLVPIPRALVEPLRRRWDEYEEQRQAEGFRDHGLVWAHADGSPLDDREDYWNWRALLKSCGIKPLALHGARNTAATKLLRDKVDPAVARDILGHSDITMTQSYQRSDLSLARAALEAGD